jgi:hypothetical protein
MSLAEADDMLFVYSKSAYLFQFYFYFFLILPLAHKFKANLPSKHTIIIKRLKVKSKKIKNNTAQSL